MTVVPATGAAGRAVDRLVLSTPDAFLASVPHMVGFDCADSVVLVGLGPNPADRSDRSGMVRLVQRFDTPPSDTAPRSWRRLRGRPPSRWSGRGRRR